MDTQDKKSWMNRNWKWCVPVGCLTSIALFVGFVVLIVFFAFSMMKSSDVYKEAVSKAKVNPTVQMSIGVPIEAGLIVSGNINVSGPSGEANLAIPIEGPDGEATIYLVATKYAGKWIFSTLVVEITKNNNRINLIEADGVKANSE